MADSANPVHVPVLLAPVLAAAAGARRAVDATLGDGGHAEALRRLGRRGARHRPRSRRDRGEPARAWATSGIRYLQAAYSAPEALAAVAAFRPDFILLDLGVSSRQLDEAERGFTFRPGAPLDMRMGARGRVRGGVPQLGATRRSSRGSSASTATSARRAGWRGRSCGAAGSQPFAISDDLVNAIRAVLGPRAGPAGVRPAVPGGPHRGQRRAGRARRARCPRSATRSMPGGRLAVITYHSGEDRLVKHGVPGVGQRLHLPAAAADLHLPGPAARPAGAAQADRARARRSGGEPPRAERAPPDLPGGRCSLRGGTG